MKRNFLAAVGLAALVFTSNPAFAEDTDWMAQMMTFQLEGDHIVASGAFAPDTGENFKAFLAANGKANEPWNIALYVRSPGGSLVAALDMGQMLRDHDMSVVAYDMCASACTYMLMGGTHRVITREGQYAVHQFSFADSQVEPDKPFFSAHDLEKHQAMIGELSDYADQMGIDPRVVAVASRTPPSTVTILTRKQLVDYKVENVPTDMADGQPKDAVFIPGVSAPQVAEKEEDANPILESLKIKKHPKLDGLKLNLHIASAIATGMARRLVLAEAQDLPTMEQSLQNSYAANVEYNGHIRKGTDVIAEKRRMVKEWGVRRRTIDESTVHVSCTENDITCTVTGEYDSVLGVSEDSFLSNARWHFEMEVILPTVLPRVTVEKITEVK